jgi:hypothetical protein
MQLFFLKLFPSFPSYLSVCSYSLILREFSNRKLKFIVDCLVFSYSRDRFQSRRQPVNEHTSKYPRDSSEFLRFLITTVFIVLIFLLFLIYVRISREYRETTLSHVLAGLRGRPVSYIWTEFSSCPTPRVYAPQMNPTSLSPFSHWPHMGWKFPVKFFRTPTILSLLRTISPKRIFHSEIDWALICRCDKQQRIIGAITELRMKWSSAE